MDNVNDNTIRLAIILDNEVLETLNTHERFGAILLSNPTIVDITDSPLPLSAILGASYDPDTNEIIPKG